MLLADKNLELMLVNREDYVKDMADKDLSDRSTLERRRWIKLTRSY